MDSKELWIDKETWDEGGGERWGKKSEEQNRWKNRHITRVEWKWKFKSKKLRCLDRKEENQSKSNWLYLFICCCLLCCLSSILMRQKSHSLDKGLWSCFRLSCTVQTVCAVGVTVEKSSRLCDSTMCCTVNTLKDPYHPCVWCLNASLRQTLILMGSRSR